VVGGACELILFLTKQTPKPECCLFHGCCLPAFVSIESETAREFEGDLVANLRVVSIFLVFLRGFEDPVLTMIRQSMVQNYEAKYRRVESFAREIFVICIEYRRNYIAEPNEVDISKLRCKHISFRLPDPVRRNVSCATAL
jgi:hypothetical protein